MVKVVLKGVPLWKPFFYFRSLLYRTCSPMLERPLSILPFLRRLFFSFFFFFILSVTLFPFWCCLDTQLGCLLTWLVAFCSVRLRHYPNAVSPSSIFFRLVRFRQKKPIWLLCSCVISNVLGETRGSSSETSHKKMDNDCCAGKYSLFLITGTKLLSLYNKLIVARKTSRLQIVGADYCPLEEKTIGTNDTEFALNDTFCSLPTGILATTNFHHFMKTCSTDWLH